MGRHYDVVVVGAGVGGLTAAARLAREGLRVLVVEQDSHPGGTAYTFIRRGFQFPMGPLGFSSPGLVREAWEGLTGEPLELRRVDYLVRAFGLETVISHPFPLLEEELARIFPKEAAGIREFFEAVMRTVAVLRDPAAPAGSKPASDYLRGLVGDERLRRILGSLGTLEPYSSLALIAAQWELMCNEGIHYPVVGFRRFCDGLAAAVTAGRSGSEIMLRSEVEEITASGGRATGVVLGDGTCVSAGAVISNADFKSTFLSLLAPGEVPPEWRDAVSGAKQTSSNLQVSLGVDAGRVDLSAFDQAGRIIYRRDPGAGLRDAGVDWDVGEIDPQDLARQELELCLWSAGDEGLAPHGGAVLVIRTAAFHRHFIRFRPPGGGARVMRTHDYQDYKRRLGLTLVEEAGRVLPGLPEAVEVMDVATPLTFEDRGRRSDGAVAGWSWDFEEGHSQVARALVRTPLVGLYMTGYQAFSSLIMGGVPTAMESGLLAAEAVFSGAPPVSEVII